MVFVLATNCLQTFWHSLYTYRPTIKPLPYKHVDECHHGTYKYDNSNLNAHKLVSWAI